MRTYWWGGIPYYYANNSYYIWDGGAGEYEAVEPPEGLDHDAASELLGHTWYAWEQPCGHLDGLVRLSEGRAVNGSSRLRIGTSATNGQSARRDLIRRSRLRPTRDLRR